MQNFFYDGVLVGTLRQAENIGSVRIVIGKFTAGSAGDFELGVSLNLIELYS